MEISKEALLPHVQFKTSRSGGPGGQNVNKVSTKVELRFDLSKSRLFSEDQKHTIAKKLQKYLQADGLIQVVSQESRSQLENKTIALNKLANLLKAALFVVKPRKPSKPGWNAVQRRLNSKKNQALKKIQRSKNWVN